MVKNPTRNDSTARSFSINCITGKWSDFATGKAGNDLIGLIAYVKGISNIEACFYIGVPRPKNNKPKSDVVEFPKTGLGSNGTANRLKVFLLLLMALTRHVLPHLAWRRNCSSL